VNKVEPDLVKQLFVYTSNLYGGASSEWFFLLQYLH
jgi:hypothetical protein